MATHSSILVWKTPWIEEPGRLQSTGSQTRTQLSDFTFFSLIYYFNIVTACNVSNIQLNLHSNDCRDSSMCQCQKDLLK